MKILKEYFKVWIVQGKSFMNITKYIYISNFKFITCVGSLVNWYVFNHIKIFPVGGEEVG